MHKYKQVGTNTNKYMQDICELVISQPLYNKPNKKEKIIQFVGGYRSSGIIFFSFKDK